MEPAKSIDRKYMVQLSSNEGASFEMLSVIVIFEWL